jgi:hypothetical protein
MNDQAKGFLQSKTLWGVVIAGLAAFFPTLLPKLFGTQYDTSELAQYVVQGIALAVAAYGRIKAQGPIVATPIVKQVPAASSPVVATSVNTPPPNPPVPPVPPAPRNPDQGW